MRESAYAVLYAAVENKPITLEKKQVDGMITGDFLQAIKMQHFSDGLFSAFCTTLKLES